MIDDMPFCKVYIVKYVVILMVYALHGILIFNIK